MGLYNFSSTNPEHYNRIQVSVPNHFLSGYCKVCVSTFTCNCNIEVMNERDYIEFLINDVKTKVFMASHSKLSSASISDVLQEIFDKNNVKITVSITSIDTIEFVCAEQFSITDMSYNMRLITGFYCVPDSKFPVQSVPFQTQEIKSEENENVDLINIEFDDLYMKFNNYVPLVKHLTPTNASGFTIQYVSENENIAVVDESGYVAGIGLGQTRIVAEVRNYDSSIYVQPDFKIYINVIVAEAESQEIRDVSLPQALTIKQNDIYTIYPKITPFNAIYSEEWESSNKEIATVRNGYIRGISPGKCIIRYTLNNRSYNQTFENIEVQITITPETTEITKYKIASDTVGYMLSTPILYLLTNIGNSVFFNEMKDQKKLQCGTVCMCLNNSYSASYPIIAQQGEIITRCAINATSDLFFILVDANMREIKLLNPMYITVQITPDDEQSFTPGVGQAGLG